MKRGKGARQTSATPALRLLSASAVSHTVHAYDHEPDGELSFGLEAAEKHVVGGISPLGQRRRLPTVVDDEMPGHDTVFVSAGRRGLEIELAPAALVELTGATIARIRRER